jgi:predicted acylesterase/phospholipase RssA/CRP-like cAMP-binding protein
MLSLQRSEHMEAALLKGLAQSDLFASVPAELLKQTASAMELSQFAAGEVLMRQGDYGDSLCLLLSGSVLVSSNAGLRTSLEPGSVLGELSLVAAYPRSATVIAEDNGATAAWLARAPFDALRQKFPDDLAPVTDAIERRLASYQLAAAAHDSRLLNRMTPELRGQFVSRLRIESLPSGGVLMRVGESGEQLYVIVSGRLRVLDGDKVVAELSKGDTVGETSLMTGDARSATVIALRDSLVASLSLRDFRELIAEFPLEMMSVLTRQLTERAARSAEGRTHDQPPVAIAVIPLSKGVDGAAFTQRLKLSLERFGEVLVVSGHTPVVRNTNHASESRLVEWLNEQENNYRHVLYEAGVDPDEVQLSRWTERAMRQADRIYLLADADEDPMDSALRSRTLLETHLEIDSRTSLRKEVHLVLLHRSGAAMPTGTAEWRKAFPAAQEHHHIRLDRDGDFARLARSIHHRMVGLALGGGFALGIAHIGVIRAMRELKIPIDCVGGTSMGALVGVQCAMDMHEDRILEVTMSGCAAAFHRDYTLPVLSFLSGAKLGRTLAVYLEKHNIEDLWLPYFSISASLKRASMVIHREGDVLRSVLASSRAPVMFPPLPWRGDLLVDGGLVNNVPADVMRATVRGGTVFAVDVSPDEDLAAPAEEPLHVSGWSHARRRWGSGDSQAELTLVDVLGRIIRLGGVSRAQQIRTDADCYLLPPLSGYKSLDFKRGRSIAEVSYRYSLEALGTWMQDNPYTW